MIITIINKSCTYRYLYTIIKIHNYIGILRIKNNNKL